MIHEFRKEFLELPLHEYTLTFDDGLLSPLLYWDEINKIKTTKIFFITPSFLSTGFEGKPTGMFLSIDDLKFLNGQPDVIIGAHSYSHSKIPHIQKLSDRIDAIKSDTEQMIKWFQYNINITPTQFCFPYNIYCPIYQTMLERKYGFTDTYGSERIDIETLI